MVRQEGGVVAPELGRVPGAHQGSGHSLLISQAGICTWQLADRLGEYLRSARQ